MRQNRPVDQSGAGTDAKRAHAKTVEVSASHVAYM
jgi:hypothetical protein